MDKSEPTQAIQTPEQSTNKKKSGPLIMFVVTVVLVVIAIWQFSGGKGDKKPLDFSEQVKSDSTVDRGGVYNAAELELENVIEPAEQSEPEIEQPVIEETSVEQTNVTLPLLDESDTWIQEKLPELTWRNELLSLLITEDMIRRFVVFTDNFSQGLLAYEHSPFIKPETKFSLDEKMLVAGEKRVWQWDNKTSERFDRYVDLLRSIDSSTLVNWYFEAKPLIDEAYLELGYDEDFTYTLQEAITRVLDMELPKSSMALTRTSVMYKYQDPALEALNDSDKLLLRMGKENLLIIKSVLLEINEKLTKKSKRNS